MAESAKAFLRTYAFAIPGLMARRSFEQIMLSFDKTKPAMWIGLAFAAAGLFLRWKNQIQSPKLAF